MTKQEAIQAMKEGKKVTHDYMSADEWVKSTPDGTQYEFEDGVKPGFTLFWQDRQGERWEHGWYIVAEHIPFFNDDEMDWELQFD